ncbi:MAG: NAD-dependent epimerase/dehydratase, partial [Promethearchaeota archaeon CR_4]
STSCSQLAIQQDIDLYLLNRGMTGEKIPGAKMFTADIHQTQEMTRILANHTFDVVVDWIAFTPADVERDYALFQNKTKQFIFISSASAYQKPLSNPYITESTPLVNPYWEYSRNKIACEEFLTRKYRENGFPITIVRPSHTYRNVVPVAVGDWRGYTLLDRMKCGKPVVVHGDGTSLWTLTHSDDFARGFLGLVGNIHTIGHAFHITSDEILSWNQIYEIMADAVGGTTNLVHIPSEVIAKYDSEIGAGLLGDKAYSVIFDNSKIKSFVPDFRAKIPFSEGFKQVIAWFDVDERRKQINPRENAFQDKLIQDYTT